MLKSKKFYIKEESINKYWSYFWFFRLNGIIIICKNLKNIIKELKWHQYLMTTSYKFRNVLKKLNLKLILKKNNWIKFEYINNLLIIENWKEFIEIYKILEEKRIELIGFYINNILFHPKDLKFELTDKKVIWKKIWKKINICKLVYINILLILKKFRKKINILLKKR